jgi:site-specific recombinase XerD
VIDIDGFKEYLYEEEVSENTIDSYITGVKKYAAMFDEVTKANRIEFKKALLEKFKPKTVNSRITAMMRYCQYKKIPIKLKQVKEQKQTHVDNIISEEQYERLLKGLADDGNSRYIVFIKLLAKTGMRISEALRVTKKDVLNGSVTMFSKGHMRTIYFPESLVADMGDYMEGLDDADHIICTAKTRKPMTSRGMSQALQDFAVRYDIPKEVMHPHAFRHFFAIQFLKRNNNIALLADLLGHSGVNITQIYLRQSQEQQQDAVNKAVNW